ncbi:MAG: flagellar biosynthetic protein FliR [Candidatus Zixiibacteriota bacterium]|nr:MAG: flagellar biosynthetic protein FliR [candidate division Zixibacteria bacterium]
MNPAFLWDQALVLTLVFLRIATALALMPVYGFRGLPLAVKAGLAFFLALVLLPAVRLPAGWSLQGAGLPAFLALALPEVVAGLVLGLTTGFIFYGIEIAGQFVGLQMGLGIVSVMDPLSEQQTSIISQLQYFFALVIFLTFNGHHFLLEGLGQTFQAVPLGGAAFPGGMAGLFIRMAGDMFVAGVKIAAPVTAALILSEVALAITARAMPQMNVFLVGIPLKITVGLLGLALSLPMLTYILDLLWKRFQTDWRQIIALLGQ